MIYDRVATVMVYHVYILASATGVLYSGVTNYLERRVGEHQRDEVAGFTREYGVHRLVYFEPFGDVRNAIAREKQLKRWRREKKVALIRRENPGFKDLTTDFAAMLSAPWQS
jgi:putative endonuclease